MAPELPDSTTKLSTTAFIPDLQKAATFLPSSQDNLLNKMTDGSETAPENQYTKLRWLLTIAGLIFYVVDIWTDVLLALKYFQEKHFVWTGLTLMFVLVGLLVTQIFSYAWYSGDMNDPEEKKNVPRMSKGGFAALHVFGMGIFTRYGIKTTMMMNGIDLQQCILGRH